MLEIIIALIGSAVAGLWDLKTTEVPDEIPVLMVSAGLFLWLVHAVNGNIAPFILSLIVGTAVLAIGMLMYKYGKWGGADAWVFAAILYLVPVYNGRIFILDYLPNLVWVSTVFTVIYAIALGMRNRHIIAPFLEDVRKNLIVVFFIPVAFLMVFAVVSRSFFPAAIKDALLIFAMLQFLTIFWRYARVIETHVFVKKIPAAQLRTGDVLDNMIWRGLTYEEVAKIKKSSKSVTIKEGMRFVPVFFLALAVTLAYGNLMVWIL